jgi:hypothetical protein
LKAVFGVFAASIVSLAATPVARLISSEPVNVSGIVAPARNFVPLSVGDEVTTDHAAATVQFPDGNTVTLQPHSKLRIEQQGSGPVAHILQGGAISDVPRSYSDAVVNRVSKSGKVGGPLVPAGPMPASPTPTSEIAANQAASSAAANPALVYQTPAVRQPGSITPQASSFTGSFIPAQTGGSSPAGPEIIGPGGVTFNLSTVSTTTIVNGVSTVTTTYAIASVSQTITVNGVTAVVTTTPTTLVGDTVAVTAPTSGSDLSTITISTPSSSGGPPVTVSATTIESTVQAATQTVVNSGTVTGIASGTTVPTPTMAAVTTGSFSSGAS